jgi:hypothetical protein
MKEANVEEEWPRDHTFPDQTLLSVITRGGVTSQTFIFSVYISRIAPTAVYPPFTLLFWSHFPYYTSLTLFIFSSTVQRVVITSSMAAILEIPEKGQVVLSETDWNELSVREVKTKGRDAAPIHKYRTSKTLAERGEQGAWANGVSCWLMMCDLAAWDFVEKHKDSIKWDVVIINPPLVNFAVCNASPNHFNDIFSILGLGCKLKPFPYFSTRSPIPSPPLMPPAHDPRDPLRVILKHLRQRSLRAHQRSKAHF